MFEPSPEEAAVSRILSTISSWLEDETEIILNTYSDEEDTDEEDDDLDEYIPNLALLRSATRPRRIRLWKESEEWYPWPDKVTCVLDILRNLPRSTFSDKQNNIITWGLKTLGVRQVPSDSHMKHVADTVQLLCGVDTIRYQGALGHIYFLNDISQIIAQEMANPKVRPLLQFYPEDAGKYLANANQGRRWLHDLDAELTTPMIRQNEQDFYIYEPTLLIDQSLCIPIRWFKRSDRFVAKVWRMALQEGGWVVLKYESFDIQSSDILVSFPYLLKSYQQRKMLDLRKILGIYESPTGTLFPWTYTDPKLGNRWRIQASGHRVLAFPIWLYCDDTSGNSSKRWNKHNSYLFTPAGLPHEYVHQEYNVHFLCTSNIAEPLEMVEGIVEQIQRGQKDGIWAWDQTFEEAVLVIPSVLALLGDNPMQSEFASHIGLNGNLFCRVCKTCKFVKEADNSDEEEGVNDGVVAPQRKRKRAKKKKLTKEEQVLLNIERACRFMTIGEIRSKCDTLQHLQDIYKNATTVGTKTRAKELRTEHGIKDKYQDHFIEMVNSFEPNSQGRSVERQERIDAFLKSLPSTVTSPIWRLREIDAHRDTPVEVLHVVLLGFVKYFWRDAVARILAANKALLILRISSFDTTGLGLPRLSGKPFVQFAGSLVGRDFRVIAQIAPFVLFDLLPDYLYDTWLALCALIPLIWQPVIFNLDKYLEKLTKAIHRFLVCTMRCTPRWCNKPKFHIILHLPEHIRLFGPAILYATEKFESYNALIWDLSVHSNRQAPSRDIGRGFANANRIRHLTSGGKFKMKEGREPGKANEQMQNTNRVSSAQIKIPAAKDFHCVGAGVINLVQDDDTLRRFCAFPHLTSTMTGVKRMKNSTGKDLELSRNWDQTGASRVIPGVTALHLRIMPKKFVRCSSFHVQNGEECKVNNWVIVKANDGYFYVAKVTEILQIPGSCQQLGVVTSSRSARVY